MIEGREVEQLCREGKAAWEASPLKFRHWAGTLLTRLEPQSWGRALWCAIGERKDQFPAHRNLETYDQSAISMVVELSSVGKVSTAYQLLTSLLKKTESDLGINIEADHLVNSLVQVSQELEERGESEVALRIWEIVFELDPVHLSNLYSLIWKYTHQRNQLAVQFYIQALLEAITDSSGSLISSIKDESLMSALRNLLDYEMYDEFFDFLSSLADRQKPEDRRCIYAWIAALSAYYQPERVPEYTRLFETGDLLRSFGQQVMRGLIYKSTSKGFSIMASTMEKCAEQIRLGRLSHGILSQEAVYLNTMGNAILYYSKASNSTKARELTNRIITEWPLERLQQLITSREKMDAQEYKEISFTFFFVICSVLPYIFDDRQLLRSFQHISGTLVSLHIHDEYKSFLQQLGRHEVSQDLSKPAFSSGSSNSVKMERNLRVGYIGESLKKHSVGYLSHQIIGGHDPKAITTYCYLLGGVIDDQEDYVVDYLVHSTSYFRDLRTMQLSAMIQQLRDDQLDIAVFMDGVYAYNSNLITALRVAPVQISWLGSDSPGLPEMDYFIVDPFILPDSAQKEYRERLIRMPTFVAVDNFQIRTMDREEFFSTLKIPTDHLIFGSAANESKRSPECIEAQLTILESVPDSVLLVKGIGNDITGSIDAYNKIGEQKGLMDRIRFMAPLPTSDKHRAQLAFWDIVLDTFPYTGATHTIEALYMGTPVLTKVGNNYFGRMSYSPLAQLELEPCIAWSIEEYIQKGIQLGSDPQLLFSVKQMIHESRQYSQLWDSKRFAHCLEKLYLYLVKHRPCQEISVETINNL